MSELSLGNGIRWWSTSIQPATAVLSTAEAKSAVRVSSTAEDALIDEYVESATDEAQKLTRRQFVNAANLFLYLDRFPVGNGTILMPIAPVSAINSIQYVDENGVTQTLAGANYDLDTTSEPARVSPSFDNSWPTTRIQQKAVTIDYNAGHAALAADVPEGLRDIVRMMVDDRFNNRSANVEGNIRANERLKSLAKRWTVPLLA